MSALSGSVRDVVLPHPQPPARPQRRNYASPAGKPHAEAMLNIWAVKKLTTAVERHPASGPIAEYDSRIYNGTLRDDDHQRSMPAQDWT